LEQKTLIACYYHKKIPASSGDLKDLLLLK